MPWDVAWVLVGLAGLWGLYRIVGPALARSSRPLPPGPPGLPVVGNLHQHPKSHPWLQYHEWSKTYGPLMYLNMAGQPLVVLSSARAARDLLAVRGARYSDRPRMVVAFELACRGLHILFRPYDAAYRRHQRMEAPLLQPRAVAAYQPVQDLETKQLLFDFLAQAERAGPAGLDPHRGFERTTASGIYALVYGYRLRTGAEEPLVAAREVLAEFERTAATGAYLVDTFPVLNALPACLAPWKEEAEALWRLESRLHVGNMRRGLASPGWNVTKQMRSSPEGRDMPLEEFAFDAGILADAALDTQLLTMDWFVVAWLAHGASWVPKAQKLLDQVVGRDRLPSFADRPRLSYIDAVLHEVMRWRPSVPAGVPHLTKQSDEYMGYRIPAGSIVLPNTYAIGRDEGLFGPETDSFVPERWLLEGGKAEPGNEAREKDSAGTGIRRLPDPVFGFGRRVVRLCIHPHRPCLPTQTSAGAP